QLKQCIDLQKLKAGVLEDFLTRHGREHFLHHALGSSVAITDRPFDWIAFRIDKRVIYAPTIDTDALNFSTKVARARRGFAKAFPYLIKYPGQVPAQISVRNRWCIIKTAYLLKQEL